MTPEEMKLRRAEYLAGLTTWGRIVRHWTWFGDMYVWLAVVLATFAVIAWAVFR